MLSNDDAAPVDRPEPVQGLSRRQRAGGLDAAASATTSIPAERHRASAQGATSAGIDPRAREVTLGRRQQGRLRPAAAGDRRRAGPAAAAGRRPAARPHAALAGRQPRHHRAAPRTRAARVVIGASFIGLEVAASLRAREIEVHVVAPEKRPMERILGPGDGRLRACAARGAWRRLPSRGHARAAIDGKRVTLKSGGTLEADLVVMGVGVRPRLELAEKAGLTLDRGVVVDAYPRDQRARHLRGRRHRALARSA